MHINVRVDILQKGEKKLLNYRHQSEHHFYFIFIVYLMLSKFVLVNEQQNYF